jgi:hypothetical protein
MLLYRAAPRGTGTEKILSERKFKVENIKPQTMSDRAQMIVEIATFNETDP